MTKPGYGVRSVRSCDLQWQGAKATGGGVLRLSKPHSRALLCARIFASRKDGSMSISTVAPNTTQPPKRRWAYEDTRVRRCRQLQRVLTIAYIVRREDHLTVPEIQQRLSKHFCIDICGRTVQRDLDALIELGIVEFSKSFDLNVRVYHFISCKIFESGMISGI